VEDCVFISYRRDDQPGYAGRICDRLRTELPGRVFIDTREIGPGEDFVCRIEQTLSGCKVLIAVI